ncbi:MAG: hypothetical protein MUP62_05110 [Dehalococcoidia bacterium]|nr:hypothetical protein [Dehalococcoidia bacterium]
MSRTWTLLTMAVLPLLFVAFAACGGDGEEEATETPAGSTVTAAAQTPAQPAEATPTQAAEPTSVSPQFSGSATATVTVGGQTFTFENGKCDIAPDNTWLAVNIGQAGGGEYFGLLVGANPSAPGGARPVSGGGVFTDGEIALTVEQGGSTFLMGGTSAAAAGNKVTLAADLKSGEFEGATLQGDPISGSFQC